MDRHGYRSGCRKCRYRRIHGYGYRHGYVCLNIYIYIYMYVYMCVHRYAHTAGLCVCVYIYIYIYTHTHICGPIQGLQGKLSLQLEAKKVQDPRTAGGAYSGSPRNTRPTARSKRKCRTRVLQAEQEVKVLINQAGRASTRAALGFRV